MKKKAVNRVEMVGKIYNSWSVLGHSHTTNKIAYYNCECLECNREFVVDGRNVRNGLSKRCAECGIKLGHQKQTGVKKSKKSAKEIAEHYLYNTKAKDARKRKFEWNITKEQFVKIIYLNCTYCGSEPNTTVNPTKNHALEASRAAECFITYNGIDRLDSTKGYVEGNVAPCCSICNKAKLDMSVKNFIAWVSKVAAHMGKPKIS